MPAVPLLALLASIGAGGARALEIPAAPGARVNDYAAVLEPSDRQRIEGRLAAFERDTGHQIAVAVFPSLEGEEIADFTNRLFERWRLGHQGLDDGVLLTVFLEERRVRIEVGYGLEPTLTDALARRIIEREIVPRFRRGQFAAGIEAACTAIAEATRGDSDPAGPRERERSIVPLGVVLVTLVVAALGVGVVLWRVERATTYGPRGRRRSWRSGPFHWGGGAPGGSGGLFGGSGGFGGFSGGGGLSGGGGASGSW